MIFWAGIWHRTTGGGGGGGGGGGVPSHHTPKHGATKLPGDPGNGQ